MFYDHVLASAFWMRRMRAQPVDVVPKNILHMSVARAIVTPFMGGFRKDPYIYIYILDTYIDLRIYTYIHMCIYIYIYT